MMASSCTYAHKPAHTMCTQSCGGTSHHLLNSAQANNNRCRPFDLEQTTAGTLLGAAFALQAHTDQDLTPCMLSLLTK